MSTFEVADTRKRFRLGTTEKVNGKEYVYLEAPDGMGAGYWCKWTPDNTAILLGTAARGRVCIPLADIPTWLDEDGETQNGHGWFQTYGRCEFAYVMSGSAGDQLYIGGDEGYADAFIADNSDVIIGATLADDVDEETDTAPVLLSYPVTIDLQFPS